MNRKKPHKIDVEQALAEAPPPRAGSADEEDIEIVEVVGGEPEEGAAPAGGPAASEAAERPGRGAEPGEAGQRAEALAQENAALIERLQRLQAEHENYRKRIERDREEHRQQAAMALVREMLPVLDSLERALAGAAKAGEADLRAGTALIHRQFLEALTRMGLEPMEVVGQPFDPEVHEAVVATPDPQAPPGQVLEVFERGYRFRGRLLRPARVRVSATETPGGEEEG